MKNRFGLGILTGALSMLLICCVVIYGLQPGFLKEAAPAPTSQVTQTPEEPVDVPEEEPDTNALSEKEFESKVDTIKSMVAKAYLYDVTEEEYQTMMLKGLMAALDDPYSCYYTPEEFESIQESTSGVYCGIGSYVSQNMNTGVITLVKPFKDGPANKAGILPGDILVKVDDEEVTGTDLTTVVSNMKGEPGTTVKLTIAREGEDDVLDFIVERATIEVPTVEYEMLPDDIGYIAVSSFDEVTVQQYLDAIDKLDSDGMKGLVIDLRDNGGGLYTSAVSMLDRMIKDGLLVYTETKDGTREEEYCKTNESFTKPLCILVNGQSASASEIFAGAIQDYGIGTIVGTQSFGKGIVQSLIPLQDGSAVKMTISNYYTPKGRSIHKVGITPDVVVELNDELKTQPVITKEEDNQLQKAVEVLKEKIAE